MHAISRAYIAMEGLVTQIKYSLLWPEMKPTHTIQTSLNQKNKIKKRMNNINFNIEHSTVLFF